MNITRIEQETTINYNQEEKTADIYTNDKALSRKLDKACALFPETFKFTLEEQGGRFYIIPKKYITVRMPSSKVKSPEQIQRQKEQLANMRNKLFKPLI